MLIIPVLRQSEDTGVQVVLPITCQQVKQKEHRIVPVPRFSAAPSPSAHFHHTTRQAGPEELFQERTGQDRNVELSWNLMAHGDAQ